MQAQTPSAPTPDRFSGGRSTSARQRRSDSAHCATDVVRVSARFVERTRTAWRPHRRRSPPAGPGTPRAPRNLLQTLPTLTRSWPRRSPNIASATAAFTRAGIVRSACKKILVKSAFASGSFRSAASSRAVYPQPDSSRQSLHEQGSGTVLDSAGLHVNHPEWRGRAVEVGRKMRPNNDQPPALHQSTLLHTIEGRSRLSRSRRSRWG